MNPKDRVGSKKAPLGLVPPALEIGASEAMENGAGKYGPFNWREAPIEYMSYLVAMKRHINALIDGQDDAEDTGIHHLKHIAAGSGILLDALYIPGGLIDNRPPKGPAADMLRALDKSQLQLEQPNLRIESIGDEPPNWGALEPLKAFFEATARPDMYDVPTAGQLIAETGWFNCGDPECGACPRPAEDEHHRLMAERRQKVKDAQEEPGTVFWCGHKWGEEPITDPNVGYVCGTTIHWSRVNGVAAPRGRDVAAMVPAELAVCEDSGHHIPGLHLLTCPDYS